MVFCGTEKIKSMKLANFNANATDFNKKFEGISTSERFITRFYELCRQPTLNDQMLVQSSSEEQRVSLHPPAKRQKLSSKKVKPSMEHAVLMPATSRKESKSDNETEEFDEDEMDEKIEEHYKGM